MRSYSVGIGRARGYVLQIRQQFAITFTRSRFLSWDGCKVGFTLGQRTSSYLIRHVMAGVILDGPLITRDGCFESQRI